MLDLESLRQKHAVSGVAASVFEEGNPCWEGYSGKADDAHSVSETTVFHAASLSKPLFAYCLIRSHLRGEISLDQDLGPASVEWGNSEEILTQMTIRNALCHTSGLPNSLKKGEPLVISSEPGASFRYSGVGYDLAQKTVEVVVGSSFTDWIGRELADLRIASRFTFEPEYEGRIAVGHGRDGESLPDRPRLTPVASSSLYSALTDYATFLQRVLGMCREGSEESRILLTEHVSINSELGWALGWGLAQEGRIIWQFGKNTHSRACFACDRESGVGVLTLTNSHNGMALCKDAITSVLPAAGSIFDWIPTT
jgi:CubicO group peptidase (beta-lactamase class C family)